MDMKTGSAHEKGERGQPFNIAFWIPFDTSSPDAGGVHLSRARS